MFLGFDSMAAGAEVSGEGVVGIDSSVVVVEPSSPKNPAPPSEKFIEKNENDDGNENGNDNESGNFSSDKSGDSDVSNGVKNSDSNSIADSKSELQMKEIVDMLKDLKLNPLAKEFFPSSYYYGQMGDYNFAISDKGNDGFPNRRVYTLLSSTKFWKFCLLDCLIPVYAWFCIDHCVLIGLVCVYEPNCCGLELAKA